MLINLTIRLYKKTAYKKLSFRGARVAHGKAGDRLKPVLQHSGVSREGGPGNRLPDCDAAP